MFGAASNNSNGSLFGSNKPMGTGFGNQGTTGVGFGGNTASSGTGSSGGLFGANSNNATSGNTGLFGAKSQNTGSLPFSGSSSNAGGFGAQNNQSQSGSSFGQNNQAPGNSFLNPSNTTGGNSSGGGLFGRSNANTGSSQPGLGAANNTAKPGGLFAGNTSNTAASGGPFGTSNKSTTMGGFGGTSGTQGGSSGLFGSSGATNANGNNTLFGNTSTSNQNTGGLFNANNSTQNKSGSLFGGNQTSSQSNTGGLFGTKPALSAGGSLFGSSNANVNQGSTLGQSAFNNSQPSFGWSSQPQTVGQQNNTQLNAANNSIFKLNSTQSSQASVASNQNYTPSIHDQLIRIREQWDPNSPKCILKTHFYNKLIDNELNLLVNQPRPENELPEDWDNAMSNRPSPQYIPVKVTSFTNVAERIEAQLEQVAKSRILLNSINDKQTALSSKHDLDNTTRLLKAKAKHQRLLRRLLRLAIVLAILRLKGYPLLPEEEEISKQFEILNHKLADPNGSLGKLSDVFARLAILKERSEDINYQFETQMRSMNSISVDDEHSLQVEDEGNHEVVKKISRLLIKQQIGLNHLNEVLEKDFETTDKHMPK